MIRKHGKFLTKIITFFLSLFIVFSSPSCSEGFIGSGTKVKPNGDTLTEDVLVEYISSEIYLQELVLTENKIEEYLIQDEQVEEVVMCNTVFIPQTHINEFSQNSQTKELFNDVDIKPLLAKIAIGTGVILTITILNVKNIDGLVGNIIASAAPAALKGAAGGVAIGSLLGGLVGAANEIDESGRLTAVIGFASAVAGLLTATISAITAINTGGATASAVGFGVKLFLAGVSLVASAVSGYNAIKSCVTADSSINWSSVDWNKVGESAVRESIKGATNGYMWGSIIGAIKGGLDGYENYKRFNAKYSSLNERIKCTPAEGNTGHWTGKRGQSDFVLDEPIEFNGTIISKITYKNGIPDFHEYAIGEVNISGMTDVRADNFNKASELLAKYWSKIKYMDKTWTARDVKSFRELNGYTWHELNNMTTMQLVPTKVNSVFKHLGGVSEYGWMTRQGGGYFD